MVIRYGRQSVSDLDIQAVRETLESDWLTLGPKVREFEQLIAETAGTKHAFTVNNGTSALHAAYVAADIRAGDEVIMPPLTFVATASMAILLGAKVVFADVSEDTGNIDPEKVEALITSRTKAIIGVDFAGHPCDYQALRKICDKYKLVFIVDSAHSLNSKFKDLPVGHFADLATFSFFPTKNITTGEGGAIVTNREVFAEKLSRFRSHGLENGDADSIANTPWLRHVNDFGMNYRLPDILCALGVAQILRVNEFKAARKRAFDFYDREIEPAYVRKPALRPGSDPMWHLYPIRVDATIRLDLYNFLHQNDIYVQVNYVPVYWHPVFQKLGYKKGLCPIAENFYLEELSLPIHVELSTDDLDKVTKCLNEFFREQNAKGE